MIVSIKNVGYGEGWGEYALLKSRKVAPVLIRGNTKLGDKICRNLNYKSGNTINFVVSFSKEDNKTKEESREITQEFMKEFMNGFDEDEYHLDIVEHSDTDNLHYHIRVPKVNLLTNTQLKLYYHKSDLNYKKAVIDFIAEKHNLNIGLDNKKTIPTGEVERIEKWREKFNQESFNFTTKKGRAEAERGITNHISNLIEIDEISSLDDVKAELEQSDFDIVNEGFERDTLSHYLTIQEPNGKKIKIKGDIYGKEFYEHSREDRQETISNNRSIRARSESDRPSRNEVSSTLSREREKRLRFISKQYDNSRARAREKIQRTVDENEKNSHNNNFTSSFDAPIGGNISNISSDERLDNDRDRSEIIEKFRSVRERARQLRVKEESERAREEEQRAREEEQRARETSRINIDESREKMINNEDEIERFKKEIDLVEYMMINGYEKDERKSTRSYTVMRKNDEKLIVSMSKKSNDYIYIDAHNDTNKGSIINFVQSQNNVNLGQVRKILREHINNPLYIKTEHKIIVKSSSTNAQDVEKIRYMWSKLAVEKFTESYRNINVDILNNANIRRVKDKIYFPLTDENGVIGIDTVNIKTNRKMNIEKSKKAIWRDGNLENAKRILVFESVINALSYKQMHGREGDFLIATIGTVSPTGIDSLKNIFENKNIDTRIVLCTDNDDAGTKIALSVKEIAINTNVASDSIFKHTPLLNDFNDDLVENGKSNKKTEKMKVKVQVQNTSNMSM